MLTSQVVEAEMYGKSNDLPAISVSEDDESDVEQAHDTLLPEHETFEDDESFAQLRVQRTKWWKIYLVHFLFMWNSRTFEYVSIILVASAFPEGLTATSIRGMASTLSTILFASSVGSWIDKSLNRVAPLRTMIMINHASIVTIYLMWMLWPAVAEVDSKIMKNGLFALIILLDVVETLSTAGSLLSITRDWVPALVTSDIGSDYSLTHVNAVMTRVNLSCKVASPMLLPIIVSAFSRATWIMIVMLTTLSVWILEMYVLRDISKEHPSLVSPRNLEATPHDLVENFGAGSTRQMTTLDMAGRVLYHHPAHRLRQFFSIPLWPASLCMAFLYLSVLVYSAPLLTYLLQSGMSLRTVTNARVSGSLMGFAATFTTPLASEYLIKKIGGKGKVPRILSSWGIVGRFISLVPVVLVLQRLSPSSAGMAAADSTKAVSQASLATILCLFGFLSLSRLFMWTYVLMMQELEQSEVPASHRSTFSGTGQAISSCFELLNWFATVAWGKPEQFKGLASASLCVVGASAVWFWIWARRS
ncbi:uncharacterized protein RCO7_03659 [Rhynchosporium graminicola]|uniref:Solute carrier family 40 member n=1 Tax=Rhynchosporium graminicola TaxID=2792576 RepID=A0A1E1LG72_9HELO|nr:uncharacterized protein RCO7_03659 [Rhynchosporium commune]